MLGCCFPPSSPRSTSCGRVGEMGTTYYPQPAFGDTPPPTMTVGKLIALLQTLDPAKAVVFKSPQYGCFGSNTMYSIDGATVVSMEAGEEHHPAGISSPDEETGECEAYEAWTDSWPAWEGVVIT